jgi:hypothetical protein
MHQSSVSFKNSWVWVLVITASAIFLMAFSVAPFAASWACSGQPNVMIERQQFSHGELFWVPLPANATLKVGYASPMKTVRQVAASQPDDKVLAVLNGGFFDPANGLTTSHLMLEGKTYSPLDNPRIVDNEGLKPFLPQVLNRTELRQLQCAQTVTYQITEHHSPLPEACSLSWRLGAGPRLLPELTDGQGGFFAKSDTGKVTRDPVGIYRRAARSAVALIESPMTGQVNVWLVLGRRIKDKKHTGWTMPELASALKEQGATQAMALDGGSSSSLWVVGDRGGADQWYPAMWTADGQPVERRVLTTLMIVKDKNDQ